MGNRLSIAMFAVLLCCALGRAWAEDASPQLEPRFCVEDSPLCRSLAVEIAMLDISDRLDQEADLQRGYDLLCPQDNPQCCPPHLRPLCFQIERDLVLEARRAHQSVALRGFQDCPWSKSICDSLGGFYCGPDKHWNPWAGCLGEFEPPVNCPPGWKQVGLGCEPPPPCACGFEHNSKGICIPKVCYRFGVRVPCRPLCGEDQVFVESAASPRVGSNLGRHLGDRGVQLEAAKRVRDDLKARLEAAEREIQELSKY